MNFSSMDLDSVRDLAEQGNFGALEFLQRYGFTE